MDMTSDENGFVEINITHLMVEEAACRYYKIFKGSQHLNRFTFNNKDKIVSMLGEICFKKAYPAVTASDNLTYDYLLSGKKIDVKTKVRGLSPKLNFSGCVPKYQAEQEDVTHYCFLSCTIDDDDYRMWLCGRISKADFMEKAKFWAKGDVDGSNGLKFVSDTYALEYEQMERW